MSYATPAPSGPLYEAFKEARISAVAARTAALATLHEQQPDDGGQRTPYDRAGFRDERLTEVEGPLTRDLANQPRRERPETARREAYERRLVRAQHPIPTWQGYLETEASNGNEAALAALRDRVLRRAQSEGPRLEAEDTGESHHIIYVHLRPRVRRDGRVIYRTPDGGVVADEAQSICITGLTPDAVPLALSLALDRFGQHPLRVSGTEDFRAQVAALAGSKGVNVRFFDQSLERQRASAERARNTETDRKPGHAHSLSRASAITVWRGDGR